MVWQNVIRFASIMAESEQDPSSNRPPGKEPLLKLALLVVLVGVGLAAAWLSRALADDPFAPPPLTPLVGVVTAVAGLAVGAYVLRHRPAAADEAVAPWREQGWVRFLARNGRYLALLLALLLTLFVLWRLPQTPADASHALLFWCWVGALLLYLAVFTPPDSWNSLLHRDWRLWWHENWRLAAIAVGLAAASFVLRIWRLDMLPFTLSGDEASQGLEAVRVLDGALRNPFTTGWLGVPTMSFFFNSWSIDLLGQTIFALRVPWVLVGSATVVVVFFLVKRLVGVRLALATAVILLTYHYHIHYSRLGSNQIADPFFLALALLFLYRALDRKNMLDWALVGVVCAVALYFYAGARLTVVVIFVVVVYLFLRQPKRFLPEQGRGLLVTAGAFLIVGAPMIQYALRFPPEFNARVNQVGIFQSGWLEREMELLGTGPLPILWNQFLRAVLAFTYYEDRTVWYGLREPLLSPLWAVLFWVGMGYALVRLVGRAANPRYAPLAAWWWCGMLLGGFLTESPPSSQRLITLSVPVSFFLALALWQIIRLTLGVFSGNGYSRRLANGLLAAAVLLFALTSINTYFVDYTPQRIYGGPNAEMATQIAPRLRDLSADHTFYFVGPPHMYWGFATLPYLVPQAKARDMIEPILSVEDAAALDLATDTGAVFIFHNLRTGEFGPIETLYPQGVRQDVYSPVDGRLVAVLYVLPPGFGE
ncbi:MAG: glycosyltransferase family 39 protein [Chloroflexota bacterium]